jgi:hypothetical protein
MDFSSAIGALGTELSEIAYCKEGLKKAVQRYTDLGFPVVKFLENKKTDTQVFIVSNDKAIVVIWRGSESDADWKSNFDVWQKDPNNFQTTNSKVGWVHQGFYLAISSVFDDIRSYIETIECYRAKDLWTFGHSLGGALSKQFFRFFDSIMPFTGGLGIAAPLAGGSDFVKGFNAINKDNRFWVIENNIDIVPDVPPQGLVLGYRRIKNYIYIDAKGKVIKRNNPFFQFFSDLGDLITSPFNDDYGLIDSHHPKNYYNPMAKDAGSDKRLEIWPEYQKKDKK